MPPAAADADILMLQRRHADICHLRYMLLDTVILPYAAMRCCHAADA